MRYFKRLFFGATILASFFLGTILKAQNGCFEIDWAYNYGGSERDWGNALQITSDGGYVMAGYTRSDDFDVSSNNGDWDFWIIKLDEEGQIEWEKSYGGSLNDEATEIQQTADGGYIVAGSTYSSNGDVSFNNGDEDFWVVKLDPSGNMQWERTYGGSKIDRAESIKQTHDGGYIVAGFSDSQNGIVNSNNGGFDFLVVKLSPSGDVEWSNNYGGSNPDWAFDIDLAGDGGFVVAGSTISDDGDVSENKGFYDFWVIKIDAAGALQWEKSYGGAGEDRAYSVHKTNIGFIVGGSTYSSNIDVSNNFGSSDFWVVKLDDNGELLWEKSYGGSASEWAWSIDPTSDDGFIICGRSSSSDGMVTDHIGSRDFWLVKTDASGEPEWTKSFGGTSGEVAYAVHQTDDDGYIIAGYSESDDGHVIDNYGDWDYWVVKIIPREIIVDFGNDTTLCFGESLYLSDPLSGATYLWQDGSTDADFQVTTEGLYWMELSIDDCVVRDSIEVAYIGTDFAELGNDTTLCFREPFLLDATVTGADSYLWQDGSTDSILMVGFSGTYTVEVKIDDCVSNDSITIFFNNPAVDLGRDTFICEEYFTLRATRYDDANYLWQDGSTESWLLVGDTGAYSVTVELNGCESSDTIHVGKCERLNDPCFDIPNAFSNNGDGLNDFFLPINFCPLDNYRLLILNRWGQIIFETTDPDTGWDGFYKGKRVEQGVYTYIIEYDYTAENNSFSRVEKGTVMMLR